MNSGRHDCADNPTIRAIVEKASASVFGVPLVANNFRSIIVEAIVHLALEPKWKWCSGDWFAWDFEHEDGTRLEVKQSALKQSWEGATPIDGNVRFDIAQRQGLWFGATWQPRIGRYAHIYVLAFHPTKDEKADHRDPAQWNFYVVATGSLPSTKTISLKSVKAFATAVSFVSLFAEVERVRSHVAPEVTRGDTV